ncbi:MAG: chemotaxis response regulator protein-glutamate methylesterase, partial [Bilophila sp.]
MIRVLIVDDSALIRKLLREMLQSERLIEVVATARDGIDGVKKARELRPDVVTMDITMPRLDGLSALQYIVQEAICPVIMVSSLTQDGALSTLEALTLGAFDVIAKPGGISSQSIVQTQQELIAKIKAASGKGTAERLRSAVRAETKRGGLSTRREPGLELPLELVARQHPPPGRRGDGKWAVAIGISTGGPRTLMEVIPELPADLGVPVFLVQHMPAAFTASFAERLACVSQMPVIEAAEGEVVQKNVVYLAKGGQHLLVSRATSGAVSLHLSCVPETLFVPSVDVMMDSVLSLFGAGTLGVLMTGMGSDGANAMGRIRRSGGYGIAESEETAIVWGMPREAIERGGADIVLPSYKIAEEIVRKIRQWQA